MVGRVAASLNGGPSQVIVTPMPGMRERSRAA